MIFADKIIRLRKKNGWSQEELADRLNVSRQSVSKWEGAQSVPDLNKILQLSNVFGVTTDYLLKDEIELEVFIDDEVETNVKKVTFDEANSYINLKKKTSLWQASAIFLCVVSSVPLLCLTGLAENNLFLSMDGAETIGSAVLFVLITLAVSIFILCHSLMRPYHFLKEGVFELEYGVKGMLKEKRLKEQPQYLIFQIIGVVLCILSQITIINDSNNPLWRNMLVAVMLIIIATGTFFLVIVQIRKSSVTRLLKEGRFSKESVRRKKTTNVIVGVYWLFVTALYLILTLPTKSWESSWVIWPISGVIFVIVLILSQFLLENKYRNDAE